MENRWNTVIEIQLDEMRGAICLVFKFHACASIPKNLKLQHFGFSNHSSNLSPYFKGMCYRELEGGRLLQTKCLRSELFHFKWSSLYD